MKTIELGQTGIEITDWCLGTMTFGNQTSEAEAHAQIDRALDAGLTFMDCAEIYPVNPIRAETIGLSEEILGRWFAKSGKRDQWILATKVAGPNPFVRPGQPYTGDIIRQTVENSLRRLQTDRIDLYQLHAPIRGTYGFRNNWTFDPSHQAKSETLEHMLDVLAAMDEVIRAGKVRAFGLSNDSCWGTCQWLRLAEDNGLPRVASVQNEYSPLYRMWDTDMAEMSVNEGVTLLSYSPLACGLLTGKYQNGAMPPGSRAAINGDLGGRLTPRALAAVEAWLEIAQRHGLDPAHMAMAWQFTRPFPVCPIFGATTVAQLDHLMGGLDLTLADDVVAEIEAHHRAHPLPY